VVEVSADSRHVAFGHLHVQELRDSNVIGLESAGDVSV
jgi:hypothetical protein